MQGQISLRLFLPRRPLYIEPLCPYRAHMCLTESLLQETICRASLLSEEHLSEAQVRSCACTDARGLLTTADVPRLSIRLLWGRLGARLLHNQAPGRDVRVVLDAAALGVEGSPVGCRVVVVLLATAVVQRLLCMIVTKPTINYMLPPHRPEHACIP